jgi:hypothetical protein
LPERAADQPAQALQLGGIQTLHPVPSLPLAAIEAGLHFAIETENRSNRHRC